MRRFLAAGLTMATAVVGLALAPAAPVAAASGDITTYEDGDDEVDEPTEIVAGPGGDLWFTSVGNDRIGRIDPDTGVISTYASPNIDAPRAIAASPTGPVWFLNATGAFVGRLNPDTGVVNLYGDANVSGFGSITSDGAGGAWFTSPGRVGHVSGGGTIETYAFPGAPHSITTSPDGRVWFVEGAFDGYGDVVAMDPVTHRFTYFEVPLGVYATIIDLATWADGQVAILIYQGAQSATKPANYQLKRLDPATEVVTSDPSPPAPPPLSPIRFAAGPGVSLWQTYSPLDQVRRLSTSKVLQTFTDPEVDAPAGVVTGPDGNVWFTSSGNDRIGRIDPSVSEVAIVKTRDEATVVAGHDINYHLTVSNTGSTPLTGVVITDANAPDCAGPVPDLAPGQQHTVDCAFTTPYSPLGARTNRATVDTDQTDPVESNEVRTTVVANPAVTIALAAEEVAVVVGEDVNMQVTLTNTGDVPLTDITVADPAGPDCAGPVADLPVGGDVVIECSYTTTGADVGTYLNQASVTTSQLPAQLSNTIAVQVGNQRSLAAELTAEETAVSPGNTIHYGVTVTNTGDIPVVDLEVSDPVAPDCAATAAVLGPGDDLAIDCERVATPADLGTLTNTVSVTADRLDAVTDSVDVEVTIPPSALPDVDPDGAAAPAIDWAAFFEVMGPTPNGNFQSGKPVTRAQLATALWQAMDGPSGGLSRPLTDVPADAPYRVAAEWSIGQNLLQRATSSTFAPRGTVTRAQFVRALWEMVGAPTGPFPGHGYSDVPGRAGYAAALRWAEANGLLDPVLAGDRFKPTKAVTRVQVARVLFALASTEAAWPQGPGDPALPSTVLF